jgi:homoserine O-succinyltransferase
MARSAKKSTVRDPGLRGNARPGVVIGLVNNMPDSALRATERQFRELLSVASRENIAVRLKVFALSELSQSEAARSYVQQNYEDIGELWTQSVDGLIVTGREPRTPLLSDESYWPTLAKLFDWAEEHTASTIWSCLAAHAAVLHASSISRHAFREKLSGVYTSTKAADHPLLSGIPKQWRVPQSRYNGLREDELRLSGYEILSRLPDSGADMFIRGKKSLFIYMQGHPEYEPHTLMSEYRRDIAAFLAGEREHYPEAPQGYFNRETAKMMAEFRQRALRDRDIDALKTFPIVGAEGKLAHTWRKPAIRFYANWLSYLSEKKTRHFDRTEDFPDESTPLSEGVAREC